MKNQFKQPLNTKIMKSIAFILVFFLSFTLAMAQESNFQNDFAGTLQYNASQIQSLAEAIPEDKYDWSPSDGVRSVREAILHVVGANYFFGMMMGAQPAEGIDPMSLEQTVTGKDNVLEALKNSVSYIAEAGKSVSNESLEDMVDFPDGNQYSKRMVMMIAISHSGEHKGQLIAYARMNQITPPWSQQQ